MRKVLAAPECGHLTSRILMTSLGTLSSGRSPLVSSSTVKFFASKACMTGTSSRSCNIGSPPVISTSLHPVDARRSTAKITSSPVIFLPPVKVYSLSHQEQRRLQAVSRTKMQGKPAKDDSPCNDL